MRDRWSWPGATAFVIAVCVGVGWAGALIFASSPWTETITDAGANLLTTIGGVLAGAVAAYLGSQIRRQDDEPPRPPE